jgi:hypothetical protein
MIVRLLRPEGFDSRYLTERALTSTCSYPVLYVDKRQCSSDSIYHGSLTLSQALLPRATAGAPIRYLADNVKLKML